MKLLALAGIGGATGVLIAIFAVDGHWLAAVLIAALAIYWGWGSWKLWPLSNSLGLLGVVGGSVAVAIITGGAFGSLLAVVLALVGWDLTRFLQRQARVEIVENAADLQRVHLQWLALTSGAGFLLAIAVQTLRISLGLGWVVLLGLLVALGLNWLISQFAQRDV